MFLTKWMQNERIRHLQQRLADKGFDPGPADGVFGPRTERAVLAFQAASGLAVDGVVGNETWNALFNEPLPVETTVLDSPPPFSQCFDVFGDFRLAGWQEQHLARCDLSTCAEELGHVYFGWMGPEDKAFEHGNWFGFLCHALVAPRFRAAFEKLVARGLHTRLRTFDGCFYPRRVRGGSSWSTHSWAVAVDLDAPWNRFGQTAFGMDEEVAACFEEEGFIWGGRWSGRPDAMHFQYCTVR